MQLRDRFRGDIEGLRAVAVVLVVAFHAGVGLVGGGFVGVDVFFVLSGFLITGLLVDEIARTGTISLGDFYARRVRRLLPLATLVLAATAAAAYALIPPIDRKGVAGDLVGPALWSANWRFAAESTQYMADTDKSPVLHYWSLAVEEQFYVVWPLLLLLLVGGTGLALRAWPVAFRRIALALALVIAGSLWLSWPQTDSASPFAYFGPRCAQPPPRRAAAPPGRLPEGVEAASLVAGGLLVATSLIASLALVVSTTAAEEHGWTLYLFGKSACPWSTSTSSGPGQTATYDPVLDLARAPLRPARHHRGAGCRRHRPLDGLPGRRPCSPTGRPAPHRRSGRSGGPEPNAPSTGCAGSRPASS